MFEGNFLGVNFSRENIQNCKRTVYIQQN